MMKESKNYNKKKVFQISGVEKTRSSKECKKFSCKIVKLDHYLVP